MTTGGRRIKGQGAAKIPKPNAHIRLTTREIDALTDAIILTCNWAMHRLSMDAFDSEAMESARIKLAALKQRLLTKEAVS
jgi:hypothetical protein